MNRQTNRHLKFKELLLNSLAIVAFGATSIGTNPVAAATTGSKTFSLRASDGKSATSAAGSIAAPKKEKLRKTPKKGEKIGSHTFVLGASDGTMADTEDADAAPTPSDKGYVTVQYLDRTGKTLAPDKMFMNLPMPLLTVMQLELELQNPVQVLKQIMLQVQLIKRVTQLLVQR